MNYSAAAMQMKAPITKHQAPDKHQYPSRKIGVLVIGISLVLGAWLLMLFVRLGGYGLPE